MYEDEMPAWSRIQFLPVGEIGEVLVSGPVVSSKYFLLPEDTHRAKVVDDEGVLWHRLGDVGYLDEKGRLWFCGRKSHIAVHQAVAYFPDKIENIFNNHEGVLRTALVNVTKHEAKELALCVELERTSPPASKQTVSTILAKIKKTADLNGLPLKYILRHTDGFPVDKRHNAKINRQHLAGWAQAQIK